MCLPLPPAKCAPAGFLIVDKEEIGLNSDSVLGKKGFLVNQTRCDCGPLCLEINDVNTSVMGLCELCDLRCAEFSEYLCCDTSGVSLCVFSLLTHFLLVALECRCFCDACVPRPHPQLPMFVLGLSKRLTRQSVLGVRRWCC